MESALGNKVSDLIKGSDNIAITLWEPRDIIVMMAIETPHFEGFIDIMEYIEGKLCIAYSNINFKSIGSVIIEEKDLLMTLENFGNKGHRAPKEGSLPQSATNKILFI